MEFLRVFLKGLTCLPFFLIFIIVFACWAFWPFWVFGDEAQYWTLVPWVVSGSNWGIPFILYLGLSEEAHG